MNSFNLCFTTPMKSIAAIVVPYFNELQRFNEAYFDSIQSNELFQIYFVNDGSTDGTEELIKSHYQSCMEEFSEIMSTKAFLQQNKIIPLFSTK